jgi:hypothetical protein
VCLHSCATGPRNTARRRRRRACSRQLSDSGTGVRHAKPSSSLSDPAIPRPTERAKNLSTIFDEVLNVLILEGTTLGRPDHVAMTEATLEDKLLGTSRPRLASSFPPSQPRTSTASSASSKPRFAPAEPLSATSISLGRAADDRTLIGELEH